MDCIDIVIVNWNSGMQLRDCLFSLANAAGAGVELGKVVVVDNASADDSLEAIGKVGLPLHIIRNRENRGFAVACNQGAREGEARYLLFLNPDTVLFTDSLATTLTFMRRPESGDIGIAGIQLLDDSGAVSRSCARFPTAASLLAKMIGFDRLLPGLFPGHFLSEWDHDENREVDQVMGAFFLVRRQVYDCLGGFDERFFVYFEEVDFSLRALKAGWRSFYLADARARHRGGGCSEQVKAARLFYFLRSRILFAFKHFDPITALLLMLGTLLLEPVSRLLLAVSRSSAAEMNETAKGFSMLWSALPQIIRSEGRT